MCGAFKSCSGCFVTSKLNCDSLVLKGIPIKCKSENCLSLNKTARHEGGFGISTIFLAANSSCTTEIPIPISAIAFWLAHIISWLNQPKAFLLNEYLTYLL